jgi:hypothetical protein
MLEVKRPGVRHSGFSGAGAAVAKGVFMYRAGVFSANDYPPGTFGNANVGDGPKMLLADNHTHSGYGVFPVDKLIFRTDGANQDLDMIPSGTSLIYYQGGEYETDEYDITVSGTGAAPGNKLWLNASGQIALSGGAGTGPTTWNQPPIGEIFAISAFPATNKWYNGGNAGTGVNAFKKTVWYILYPAAAQPCGRLGVNLGLT